MLGSYKYIYNFIRNKNEMIRFKLLLKNWIMSRLRTHKCIWAQNSFSVLCQNSQRWWIAVFYSSFENKTNTTFDKFLMGSFFHYKYSLICWNIQIRNIFIILNSTLIQHFLMTNCTKLVLKSVFIKGRIRGL